MGGDITDFDLSPELLEAIAPGVDPKKAQIKFDDAGTLHVLERGKDGELLHDYAMRHVEETIIKETGISKNDILRDKKRDNKEWKFYFRILQLSICSLIIPCIYIAYIGFEVSIAEYVTLVVWVGCCLAIAIFTLVKLIRKCMR